MEVTAVLHSRACQSTTHFMLWNDIMTTANRVLYTDIGKHKFCRQINCVHTTQRSPIQKSVSCQSPNTHTIDRTENMTVFRACFKFFLLCFSFLFFFGCKGDYFFSFFFAMDSRDRISAIKT